MIRKAFIIFCFLGLAAQGYAKQSSCVNAEKSIWSDAHLRAVTHEVCNKKVITDPDEARDFEQQQATLSARDNLIFEYTYRCYDPINKEFRIKPRPISKTIQLGEQLDAILCAQPIYSGAVYRGTNLPHFVLESLKLGAQISFPGFTSTSQNRYTACRFAENIFIEIKSKNGRVIADRSREPGEEEVLFKLNSQFKVQKKLTGKAAEKESGCSAVPLYVLLEEV